jgi:hypothetical protein
VCFTDGRRERCVIKIRSAVASAKSVPAQVYGIRAGFQRSFERRLAAGRRKQFKSDHHLISFA